MNAQEIGSFNVSLLFLSVRNKKKPKVYLAHEGLQFVVFAGGFGRGVGRRLVGRRRRRRDAGLVQQNHRRVVRSAQAAVARTARTARSASTT